MHRIIPGVFDIEINGFQTGQIVFAGDSFSSSKSLFQAVEREFSDLEITVTYGIDVLLDRPASCWQSARLLVMDAKACSAAREGGNAEIIRDAFHNVIRAIAYDDVKRQEKELLESVRCDFINGFLPMNQHPDIWLSVIRLMLYGGNFIPAELIEPIYRLVASPANRHPSNADMRMQGRRHIPSETGGKNTLAGRLSALTDREMDVLRLAAQGYQNKSIAVELGISEHTIKLHMHHVISKLGAHNRTEAAAAYIHAQAHEPDIIA